MAGTVADILDLMELLDNELRTGSGEPDEDRSVKALIQAQHFFENLAATYPDIFSSTVNTTTADATETSSFAVLRVDALWYLDTNGRPVRKLKRIEEIGGHVPSLPWPLQITIAQGGSGAPFGYFANMQNFYWLPLPDGVHTVRIYALLEQTRFSTRSSSVFYPYRCHLPFAQFATKLLSVGLGDAEPELEKLGAQVFTPLIRQLQQFDRSEPSSRHYTEFHST